MDTLTASEESTLNEFVSITSYPHAPHTAIHYLQENDWNLERSIIVYFESSPEANQQLNNNSNSVIMPGAFNSNVGAGNGQQTPQPIVPSSITSFVSSIKKKIQNLGSQNGQYLPLSTNELTNPRGFISLTARNKFIYLIQLLLYIPILVLYKVSGIVFYVLAKLFPFFKRLTARYSQNRHSSKSEPKGIDPAHIARNFISDFNTYYRNDDRIDFFEGGYSSALYIAKRDARFLVVYLHSDEHDDTNSFVNDTLLNEKTLKFFNDHNILIWGGDVHESEAYQVADALSVTKFPFLGLLCLKTTTQETPDGTTTSSPTLTCVSRTQGLISAEKLTDKFSSQIERFEPALVAIRAERQQEELSRVIREQQDQAFQASLQRDRQIQEERRQAQLLQQNKKQFLKWRYSQLLPEVDESLKGEYSRVAIRLNNGSRITRRFPKDAVLEELYAYVELNQLGYIGTTIENVERPANFTYTYPFTLISPMPRRELHISYDTLVKDEPLIWPNGNLVVEETE